MTPAPDKRALRAAGQSRRGAAAVRSTAAGEAVAAWFLAAVPLRRRATVAGYWPVRDELDCRGLMTELTRAAHPLALPVVAGEDRPLAFRAWTPGMALEPGTYGIPAPPRSSPLVRPHLVLVPLLAFDARGHRLGYGGGYYDRTIGALRRGRRPPLIVGLAYAAQEIDAVPAGGGDEALDWVVTEDEARRIA